MRDDGSAWPGSDDDGDDHRRRRRRRLEAASESYGATQVGGIRVRNVFF